MSHQHIIGHMGKGFYGSNDSTNSVKALKEHTKLNKGEEGCPALHGAMCFDKNADRWGSWKRETGKGETEPQDWKTRERIGYRKPIKAKQPTHLQTLI